MATRTREDEDVLNASREWDREAIKADRAGLQLGKD
jgi:hypothetical protein